MIVIPRLPDLKKTGQINSMDLTLSLKSEYFYQIKAGTKHEEFRLCTPYWTKRLVGRSFDKIVLTLGYPKKNDIERRLELYWCGFIRKQISHPRFGNMPVEVFAIDVTQFLKKSDK